MFSNSARFMAYGYPRYFYYAGFACARLKTDCGLFRGDGPGL